MWTGTDPDDLMTTWRRELAPYSGEDIKGALESLRSAFPEWPPALFQFADLCRAAQKRRQLDTPRLDGPRVPMPDHVRQQLAEFKSKYPGTDSLMAEVK